MFPSHRFFIIPRQWNELPWDDLFAGVRLHCDGGGYAHALPCIVHGAVGIFAPCLVDRLELAEGAQAEVVERHADASHSESEHFMDGQCFFSFF